MLTKQVLFFLLIINPLLLQGKVDSLRYVVLDEVQVFEKTVGRFQTEKPKRKNFKGLRLIEPSQLAVVFDQKQLVFKKLGRLSVYFSNNQPANYVFRLAFYTVGTNGQPDQLIKTRELVMMRHKSGWQDFRLDSENIRIPADGLAVVFYLMPQNSFSGLAVSRIGLGTYRFLPKYYTRSSDAANWIDVSVFFKDQGIAPMLQLAVEDE